MSMSAGDTFFMILMAILILVAWVASIIGAIIIYKVYISKYTFGEFMRLIKTQGYLKSLFRFDKLISPKLIQFFYGLSAVGIICIAIIMLVVMLYQGIANQEIRLILSAIFVCIAMIIFGELFVRIAYEFAIILFKMNESLGVLKDAQISSGFTEEAGETVIAADVQINAQPEQPVMKYCPTCGTQNNAAAKFCKGCGTAL